VILPVLLLSGLSFLNIPIAIMMLARVISRAKDHSKRNKRAFFWLFLCFAHYFLQLVVAEAPRPDTLTVAQATAGVKSSVCQGLNIAMVDFN